MYVLFHSDVKYFQGCHPTPFHYRMAAQTPTAAPLVLYVPPMNLMERVQSTNAETQIDLVVTQSPFEKIPADLRIAKVVEAFNKNVKEPVIVGAGARAGDRIEPGTFLLCHRNKVPEVAAGTGERLTIKITGGYTETGFLGRPDGKYKQTEPIIGDYGSYIVNVNQGMYAKVWSGNVPKLLGEGVHVIHDTLFRAEGNNTFVKIADSYISHGTIHVIRVAMGSYGKVMLESKPFLLPYRKEPYVFCSAMLKYEGIVPESSSNIDFGTLHLIRVPAGSVARVWIGSKPLLLEYRDEPYFFDDPLFRSHEGGSVFVSANVKHIQHGSINRLRPGVDGDVELAVVQHDGDIHFIDRFTTIDDPSHAVLGFLNMGLQTHIFPSKATRDERRRENAKATVEEIAFEPMTTRDSLKVGMKLLVAFQINDPHRLLKRLRLNECVMHVENLAVSDMARAVQNSTSQNFLHSSGRSHHEMEDHEMSIADRVRKELATHLEDCGIRLVRFSIEEAKVLDEDLAKEMAKQALVAATASAQQAVIEQKAAVARSNAELDAMASRVKQDQENQIRISAAQAELEAERLRSQAIVVKAEAQAKAAQLQGQQFREYPELLQLELARLQMDALRNSRVVICAESLTKTPFVNLQAMLREGFVDPSMGGGK